MNSPHLSFPRAAATAALLLGAFASLPSTRAQTPVVLDDFSTDKFSTNYVQKLVPGGSGFFGTGGWVVSGGELQPETADASIGGYAAYVWTGNALQNVGDSFSIDLSVSATGSDHNGGLSVWTSASTTFDRVVEPRLGYNGSYTFVGSDQNSLLWSESPSGGTISGPATLTVALSGRTATDSTLTISLSDANGTVGTVHDYTVLDYVGSFYVGPSAWQATGGNVAFDNLTFAAGATAVPEPATYAAILGALGLGLGLWCRSRGRTAVLEPIR